MSKKDRKVGRQVPRLETCEVAEGRVKGGCRSAWVLCSARRRAGGAVQCDAMQCNARRKVGRVRKIAGLHRHCVWEKVEERQASSFVDRLTV